jgi:CRP-like cAMP-binding protein
MNEFADKESRLDACLKENNTGEAVRILSDLAISCARKKQFQKAEQYRDRLYDVDEMALTNIIRVNEIIEEEKSQGIDVDHRQLFSALYELLPPHQANALFYVLEEINVPSGEVLRKQGDTSDSLFFLNTGKLSVTYKQNGRTTFLGSLEPGTFFGVDTFFSNSICTVSITAHSSAKLFELHREVFRELVKEHAGIQAILRDFCSKNDTIATLIKQQELDRRRLKRENLMGKALIQLLDNAGKLIGKPLRVELHDISSGGTSFMLRISQEEKASLMLGRKLVIQFSSATASPPLKFQKKGIIVAVSPSTFDDYSFHIKFDSELMPRFHATILSAFSKPS